MTKNTQKVDSTIKAEDIKSAATEATSKVSNGAREFVRRSAATAKERSDNMYENTEKLYSGLENTLTRAAGGYVSILGGIAAATHDNVNRALTTVEQLANAKSVSEAVRIQSDYVRDNTQANVARARVAMETVREATADTAKAVRENATKAWPYGKKAA